MKSSVLVQFTTAYGQPILQIKQLHEKVVLLQEDLDYYERRYREKGDVRLFFHFSQSEGIIDI